MPFQLIPHSRRTWAALALALGASFAIPAQLAAQDLSPDKPAALSKEGAQVKKLLEQKFDGVSVSSVVKSPYGSLYEVMFDDQMIYTDAKVSFVIVGNLYDTATKKNMTDAKMRELTRVAFDSLPLDLAIKKVKGNGSRRLAIFSDADCPFCARLENELKSIDNVTIYTFLYPIDQLHPDAARKSKMIWCSPDKAKAWDSFFSSGALPQNNGDCDTPIAATHDLGQKLKVSATPTLVFADGSIVPGALPAQRLETEIANGELQASRLAAAKKK
jgi:thiol:disulfide interchange protein DsbC